MTAPYDRRSDVFTDWLDAQVTGKSTPDHELAADADLADLCAAADQFHELAEGLGQDATRVSPSTRSWEDIMAVNPALRSTSPSPVAVPPVAMTPSWLESPSRLRFDRFITGALAVMLVVAIGGGAWLVADRTPFGGGKEPPGTIDYGSLGSMAATPDFEVVDLPTAADCTIEPLTIDEVLWYIRDPWGATYTLSAATPAPSSIVTSSVGSPDMQDPTTWQNISETQRMWMACVLAESPFQAWAVMYPYALSGYFRNATPAFTTEDEAREMLEALQSDSSATPPGLNNGFGLSVSQATCADVWSVETSPEYVVVLGNQTPDTRVVVSAAGYNPSGDLIHRPVPIQDGEDTAGVFTYSLVWNEVRSAWLIASEPYTCG